MKKTIIIIVLIFSSFFAKTQTFDSVYISEIFYYYENSVDEKAKTYIAKSTIEFQDVKDTPILNIQSFHINIVVRIERFLLKVRTDDSYYFVFFGTSLKDFSQVKVGVEIHGETNRMTSISLLSQEGSMIVFMIKPEDEKR